MKYQLAIVESRYMGRTLSKVVLAPKIEIRETGYWQRLINKLITDCNLDERAVV
jgi:hypothetical protein